MNPPTTDAYARIADRVAAGAALVRRWPLRGGVSAHIEALEVALPGGELRRVVLRRHGAAAWKTLAADVTVTEFELLTALAAAGLPVPEPVFLHASNDLLGSPFFVMEFVEGTTEVDDTALPDALRQMADYLARLHALRVDVPRLPPREDPVAGALAYLSGTDPISVTLRERGALSANPPALLHGDYWPGNVLWRDGRIAAVIDWEEPPSEPCCAPLIPPTRRSLSSSRSFSRIRR